MLRPSFFKLCLFIALYGVSGTVEGAFLREASSSEGLNLVHNLKRADVDGITQKYRTSKSRAIFTDFDYTLTPGDGSESRLTKIAENIRLLAGDEKNTQTDIYIVSLRPPDFLQQAKNIGFHPRITYVGEGGAVEVLNQGEPRSPWHLKTFPQNRVKEMKERFMKIMTEKSKDGKQVESTSLGQYSFGIPLKGEFEPGVVRELVWTYEQILEKDKEFRSLVPQLGQHAILFQDPRVSKGAYVKHVLERVQKGGKNYDFVLSLGDEGPDESMHQVINSYQNDKYISLMVKGKTNTELFSSAQAGLHSHQDVNELFEKLAVASQES